jgi:hypothetical protein
MALNDYEIHPKPPPSPPPQKQHNQNMYYEIAAKFIMYVYDGKLNFDFEGNRTACI